VTKFIKTFPGWQTHQVVEQQVNQHFKNHLCSHQQGNE